ncbi:MAG: formate dehydrogenase family accessory protein FdhD [Halobacteriovoraceae bacterium]|nr:formate dehydrogenase family accessory protein FdhD [Halobacteriovoraceae bacterium]
MPFVSIDTQKTITYFKSKRDLLRKEDFLAIEEPLEMTISYKGKKKSLSLTMRTPGSDQDLVVGYLLAEGIINTYDDIDWSQKGIVFEEGKNSHVCVYLNKEPVDLGILERNSYMSSSCGVCGKASIESLDVLQELKDQEDEEISRKASILSSSFFFSLPNILRKNQDIFEKTGGLHGAMLVGFEGEMIALREDVGRHNAVDKLFGYCLLNRINTKLGVLLLSGRISFELIQKASKSGVKFVAGIGAPSSFAVSLARKNNITLVGFLKEESFNCYTGNERILYD